MSTHPADVADTPNIETTRWRIDPARSRVEFHAKTFWGLSTVRGRFSRYHGTLDLSNEPAIDLAIETNSLDTNHKKRDAHLCSPAFFDAETHPCVRFVSESTTLDGGRLKVRGRLHARGNSVPLELDATLRRIRDEIELEAVTHADHRQLGMRFGSTLGALSTPSQLIVTGRLVPFGTRDGAPPPVVMSAERQAAAGRANGHPDER